MISQYTGSYSNPPADVQNLIANKVKLLDSYILFQTGENEYKAIVYDNVSKRGEEYTISRPGSGYYNYYTVSSQEVDTFEYTVSNEYYVYSNTGVGKSLDLPVMEGVTAHSVIILACVVMFAIVFKGVLFKCLRIKR